MTQLSEHFSLSEFEKSEYSQRKGIPNIIPVNLMANAIKLAMLMEQVRKLLNNKMIIVNSAYRSPTINKAVGGAKTSEHLQALACDFICPTFGTPFEIAKIIEKSGIEYGQLIYEGTWVHISVAGKHHKSNMTMKRGKYYKGIQKV